MGPRLGLAALIALVLVIVPASAPPAVAGETTQMGVNAAHDGFVRGELLRPPVRERWRRSSGLWTRPAIVVADGLIATSSHEEGPDVHHDYDVVRVLDQATGRQRWSVRTEDEVQVQLAYEAGRLFVLEDDGRSALHAYDARSGRPLWSVDLGEGEFHAPITVADGRVYLSQVDGNTWLYVFDAASGTALWQVETDHGGSAPAIADGRALMAFVGPQINAFRIDNGTPLWNVDGCCIGGGSTTPATAGGLLYTWNTFDEGLVYDTATGAQRFTFTGFAPPVVAGDTMVVTTNMGTVEGRSATTGALRWSTPTFPPRSRDPLPVVVANGIVWAPGHAGEVLALRLSDGAVLDAMDVGAPIAGLAIGGGSLVVTAGNQVIAYEAESPGVLTEDGPAADAEPAGSSPALAAASSGMAAASPAGAGVAGQDAASPRPRVRLRAPKALRLRAVCRGRVAIRVTAPRGGRVRIGLRARRAGRSVLLADGTRRVPAGARAVRLRPRPGCASATRGRATLTARVGSAASSAVTHTLRLR